MLQPCKLTCLRVAALCLSTGLLICGQCHNALCPIPFSEAPASQLGIKFLHSTCRLLVCSQACHFLVVWGICWMTTWNTSCSLPDVDIWSSVVAGRMSSESLAQSRFSHLHQTVDMWKKSHLAGWRHSVSVQYLFHRIRWSTFAKSLDFRRYQWRCITRWHSLRWKFWTLSLVTVHSVQWQNTNIIWCRVLLMVYRAGCRVRTLSCRLLQWKSCPTCHWCSPTETPLPSFESLDITAVSSFYGIEIGNGSRLSIRREWKKAQDHGHHGESSQRTSAVFAPWWWWCSVIDAVETEAEDVTSELSSVEALKQSA